MIPPTIKDNDNAARLPALLGLAPWLTTGADKTCLYIGAMPTRADFLDRLLAWGWAVDVLEVHAPYVAVLATWPEVRRVYAGDVRTWFQRPGYDLAFWWHGPEHVPAADVPGAVANLERLASAVVLGCPYGDTGSGDTDGNAANNHVSAWQGPEFVRMGYAVSVTDYLARNVSAVKGTP